MEKSSFSRVFLRFFKILVAFHSFFTVFFSFYIDIIGICVKFGIGICEKILLFNCCLKKSYFIVHISPFENFCENVRKCHPLASKAAWFEFIHEFSLDTLIWIIFSIYMYLLEIIEYIYGMHWIGRVYINLKLGKYIRII